MTEKPHAQKHSPMTAQTTAQTPLRVVGESRSWMSSGLFSRTQGLLAVEGAPLLIQHGWRR